MPPLERPMLGRAHQEGVYLTPSTSIETLWAYNGNRDDAHLDGSGQQPDTYGQQMHVVITMRKFREIFVFSTLLPSFMCKLL